MQSRSMSDGKHIVEKEDRTYVWGGLSLREGSQERPHREGDA